MKNHIIIFSLLISFSVFSQNSSEKQMLNLQTMATGLKILDLKSVDTEKSLTMIPILEFLKLMFKDL